MDLTLIIGLQEINKRRAVERAATSAHVDSRALKVVDIAVGDGQSAGHHPNPDYRVRYQAKVRRWKQVLRDIRASSTGHFVILSSAFSQDSSGLEPTLPTDMFRSAARSVQKAGGTVQIVVLIGDLYDREWSSSESISVAAHHRHLEWTFAQFLASQFSESERPIVRCFSTNHPLRNLSNVLARWAGPAVYLCHPINEFRRNPQHTERDNLDMFRKYMTQSYFTLYDPLGIDEEILAANSEELAAGDNLLIHSWSRWPLVTSQSILPREAEPVGGEGYHVRPRPTARLRSLLRSQLPQRDFFWIDSADVVVAWRPFLGKMHHAGVVAELQYAIHRGKRIIAYSPVQDGGEHPSPFASMVKTYSDFGEFQSDISLLSIERGCQDTSMTTTQYPPKYCDHTSVGVLIYNSDNELLLIERGTFPFGMAVPAGHVDEHATYEEAAIAEVREEVGLDVQDLTLVAEGRRENPCRRVNGKWHYWKIFEARVTGHIRLSPREAKRAEWCSPRRLMELGLVTEGQNDDSSGLERVWLDWLTQLDIIHLGSPRHPKRGGATE